jgi:hypothetical protein
MLPSLADYSTSSQSRGSATPQKAKITCAVTIGQPDAAAPS